jgi:hypothetical protein
MFGHQVFCFFVLSLISLSIYNNNLFSFILKEKGINRLMFISDNNNNNNSSSFCVQFSIRSISLLIFLFLLF